MFLAGFCPSTDISRINRYQLMLNKPSCEGWTITKCHPLESPKSPWRGVESGDSHSFGGKEKPGKQPRKPIVERANMSELKTVMNR